MQWLGATAETTDKVFDLAGTTGGGIINASGTGLFKITQNLSTSGGGAKTLTLSGSGSGEFAGTIGNSGGGNTALTKIGAGTWTLSGANSYSGGTLVSAGTLVGDTTSLQGTITNNAALHFAQSTNGAYAGVISGSGSLTKSGNAILTLAGSNSYGGGSALSAGTLRLDHANALGSGSLAQTDGASKLQVNAGGTIANNMSLYHVEFVNGGNTLSGTITQNNTTYDVNAGETNNLTGFLTGSGGVTLVGGGVLNITGTTNNYTGATTISNGTLRIGALANAGSVSSIGTNGTINLGGPVAADAVLDYTGGDVATDRAFIIANGGGTLNMASSATEMNLTGSADGAGTLIIGEGTLVLSNSGAPNSFSPGSIQIDAGATLQLATNNQIGDTTGLILNGGTFRVGTASAGFSDVLGALTLSASSTIDLGAWTTGLRQLTFANSSAITWTGTLTITNWQGVSLQSSSVAEILFGTGGLTSTQLGQIYFANQNINGGALIGAGGELAPIPEAPVCAAAMALVGFIGWRERRRIRGLCVLTSLRSGLPAMARWRGTGR